MSPLRDSGPDDPVYNVAEDWVVKVAYGLAATLYALRAELIDLYNCDESHQVGGLVLGIFGLKNAALRGAPSRARAASILRNALIAELNKQSCQTEPEDELRQRVIAALTATTHSPSFDPFKVLFDDVCRRSQLLYGDQWPTGTQLFFERIADRPFPGSSRYWLNAITDLHLKQPGGPPSVHLRIHPTQLNFATYAAIYAVLVHECVCHVAAHREPQRNESPFAEGLCDWAAKRLFELWTEDRDGDAALRPAARYFGDQIWRLMMDKDGGNRFWYARMCGHVAADKIVAHFIDKGALEHEAKGCVVELVRELVVVDVPLAIKDTFVRHLYGRFSTTAAARLDAWRSKECDAKGVLLPPLT